MAGKSVWKWAVFLGVLLSTGCCHWCHEHCGCQQSCQPCCAPSCYPQQQCCQPCTTQAPTWNAPVAHPPTSGCCQ
jgi:hypothetical protein